YVVGPPLRGRDQQHGAANRPQERVHLLLAQAQARVDAQAWIGAPRPTFIAALEPALDQDPRRLGLHGRGLAQALGGAVEIIEQPLARILLASLGPQRSREPTRGLTRLLDHRPEALDQHATIDALVHGPGHQRGDAPSPPVPEPPATIPTHP